MPQDLMQNFYDAIHPGRLLTAALIYLGFIAFLFVFTKILPGPFHESPPMANGKRLRFRLNGFILFIAATLVLGLGIALQWVPFRLFYTHFWSLFIVANIFSMIIGLILYVQGKGPGDGFIRSYWMGTSYNPTWWGVDLKMFFYRPSLFLLAIFNAACAYEQYIRHGHISNGMWLYQILTYFYLASSFQFEKGMMSMYDIIAERFGFMLVWGDLVLVPFFYCLPGLFLIDQVETLPAGGLIAITLLFSFGYYLFRATNMQKNKFKSNPHAKIWGKPIETVGGRLMISGLWGIGRKMNYLGEILLYLAWTMTNGFDSFWPYLLPLWLAGLLFHRAWRDDIRCREKYGAVWDAYCAKVKFKIIPFIY